MRVFKKCREIIFQFLVVTDSIENVTRPTSGKTGNSDFRFLGVKLKWKNGLDQNLYLGKTQFSRFGEYLGGSNSSGICHTSCEILKGTHFKKQAHFLYICTRTCVYMTYLMIKSIFVLRDSERN